MFIVKYFLVTVFSAIVYAAVPKLDGRLDVPINNSIEFDDQPTDLIRNQTSTHDHNEDLGKIDEEVSINSVETDTTNHEENLNNETVSENPVNSDKPVIKDDPVKSEETLKPLILTPFIKNGDVNEARRLSRVIFQNTTIEGYSGYLTVEEKYNSNLFFWYFPSMEGKVEERPLILWLQGGPGSSVFTGIFTEIGPFKIVTSDETHSDDFKLVFNEYTWIKNHSVIFIDNPVGAGYSFTEDVRGFCRNNDKVAAQLHSALQQLFMLFPEMKMAPLFITGESYAGKYIPALAMEIHRNKNETNIKLEGLALGNALIEMANIKNISHHAYEAGMIGQEVLELGNRAEEVIWRSFEKNNSYFVKNTFNNLIQMILGATKTSHLYNYIDEKNLYSDLATILMYMNRSDVRRDLHAGNVTFNIISWVVNINLDGDFTRSFRPYMEELLEHYRVVCFLGQLDLMIPYVSASASYKEWRWSRRNEFLNATRNPWIVDNQVVGYYQTGGGFSEVMIRGAGHMVATDKPEAALRLISSFTRNIALEGSVDRQHFVQLESVVGEINKLLSNKSDIHLPELKWPDNLH